MTIKNTLLKRFLAIALAVAVFVVTLPTTGLLAATADNYYNRVVDANTMDNWKNYFDLNDLDTTNAGGVWTDKSVFTNTDAFPDSVQMLDENKNFLTALSALAANKEVVGYSTIPTDTVLVLDLSGSMENSEADLIDAANDAIGELLEVNENNRVGVVLYSASGTTGTSTYSESVTRILPIDRYTTGSDGEFLSLSNNGRVSVDGNVEGTVANADLDNRKTFGGGTYIQAGLWEAKEMFEEMDTVIGENNWQSGDDRMPILVLMSDGAPSTGTTYFDDVENSQYTTGGGRWGTQTVYESNVGNGSESDLTAGNAFLTQLTASYVMNQIEAHYQQENPDVRGLFYTLGFNIGSNNVAQSVMNPDASTFTDALWNTYNAPDTVNMTINVKNRNGRNSDVSITKNSYATSKSYVDEYFSASGDSLSTAFKSIVDEIILQSRYYPTHLEGGSPDFSGYVEFEDTLGEYMEVKHINGILLGDTLFDGHMMASKLTASTEGGLGTPENPTDLGNEFIWAVKARLGIADTADAQALVAAAWNAGQLYYNAETGEYSNYLGWYAKADGTYAGFWDESSTAAAPEDAVYKIKSYGFLGETTGSIKNSDMMYMSVQVRTDIATGQQTMLWKIPAALVPMITYLITLEGTNVDEARNVEVAVEDAESVSPIRLIFESGLRSDLNELNITRITDQKHIAADGVTRQFWSNYFDISAASHDDHITTLSEFTPSKENERFYYTFDSAVHKLVGGEYVLVEENETLDENGEYYHRRYVFKEGESTPVFIYEKMSEASIKVAKDHGWVADFVTLDGETGAYVVPAGTPARELQMYDEQKDENVTNSANMVFHPYLTEENNIFYVDMNLGNNGRLEVTPAQGIKLSKTVDIYETGTSTDFTFRVTVHNENGTPYTGTLNSWITDLDVVPLGEPTAVTLTAAGTYTVDLSADQTLWLTGVPTGATYTVEEISTNDDYKVKTVHVNGAASGTIAAGTVAAYFIDDVDFVNTAVGEGDLVVTKQVVDENGNPVDVNDNVTFTAEVTLTDSEGAPVSGTFEASNTAGEITVPANGKFTVTLKEGESFVVRNIPEETEYSVVETNIPSGFQFNADRSQLTGVVDATANDRALIVNTYDPTGTNGQNVAIDVTKVITGNRTQWLEGESYRFQVKPLSVTRAAETIADFVIDYNDSDKKYTLNLSAESYPEAGTYHYIIEELTGDQGGITYDTVSRRFAVVVADLDMDGDLEITAVNNEANTTVTQNGNSYTVAANFNNVYAPTGSATVTLDVQKRMNGDHRLNGFQFALYDSEDIANADEVLRSTVTDTQGKATFSLTYAPNRATMEGAVHTYWMAEINTGNPNITYDDTVYKVEITVKDNGDGTISAIPVISGLAQGETAPTFTNTFTPSASAYVTLTADKTVEGDRVLNANEFDFVIEALTEGAPMPGAATVSNSANGAVVFEAIEFTEVGTYKYKLYESDANEIGGFTYDGRYYEITVVVTDNGDATLSAAVTRVVKESDTDAGLQLAANELMSFVNAYDATDAKVTLSGEKLLTGKTLQDGEFNFELKAVTEGAPMPEASIVSNNENGVFTFGEMTYAKAGTYVYTLTEVATNDSRYDFDESVYTVTVTVTDNSRGTLTADVDLIRNNMASTAIVFRNGFVPTPVNYDIYTEFGGEKALEGRTLLENEFEFVLINAINGVQIGESVKNDASGQFKFPAVTIPEAGTYHFKITEVVGDLVGVSYDTASYHVLLTVEQNDDGTLSIVDQRLYKGTVTKEEVGGVLTETTSYENITENGRIRFNNSYEAAPAYVALEATKNLTGRALIDGEFKFDLYETDDTYSLEGKTPVQDDVVLTLDEHGAGKVTFMPMSFTEADTYYYVILEDEIDENGVTNDKTRYKVKVAVTDNGAGRLEATVYVNNDEVEGDIADTVVFNNTYKAGSGKIELGGVKNLEGRDLNEGEFTFNLWFADMDENGNWVRGEEVVEQVTNNADGTFAFELREAELGATYIYFITEDATDPNTTITYDDTEYMIVVTTADNLDGTMAVSYEYTVDGEEAEGVSFTNIYNAPDPTPDPDPEPTPTPDIPKTGDESNISLWIALLFVSGGVFTGIAVYSGKRSTTE